MFTDTKLATLLYMVKWQKQFGTRRDIQIAEERVREHNMSTWG